jgi:hypothetical protein
VGEAIRSSLWLFPVIESFHLVALALLGGAILIVDLRLLGLGLRQDPAELARQAQPWLNRALVVMLLSGALLFTSEAQKCYYNEGFRAKMLFLFPALVFTYTLRRRAIAQSGPWTRLAAVVSLTLWTGVAAAGRWIGFTG